MTDGDVSRRSLLRRAGVLSALPLTTQLLGASRATRATRAGSPATALAPSPVVPGPGRTADEHWRTCVNLARGLLLVGPDGKDLKLTYLRTLIDDGLPAPATRKRVLVVGAGIAGLTAALLLKKAGHHVQVVEANANRIGGRIKTFRFDPVNRPGEAPPFNDPHLYAEAGAMRLPSTHPLTLAFVDKLGLSRRLFYNVDIDPATGQQNAAVPAVSYRSFTGEVWTRGPSATAFAPPAAASRTWLNANGAQVRRRQYAADPRGFNAGFGATGSGAVKTASALLDGALRPVRDTYRIGSPDGGQGGDIDALVEGWARLIYDLDDYSMGQFLRDRARLDSASIDAIGTIQNLTSRLSLSFFHSYQDYSEISPSMTYWEIAGGTASLPYALLPELKDEIQMNQRVTRLEYWDLARDCSACTHVGPDGPAVWVETVSETGAENSGNGRPDGATATFTADVAICTVPFSALRQIEVTPLFSYHKRRAVIELHYDSATKVLLEFSKRWWEFSEADWRRELEAIRPGLYGHYQSQATTPARPATGAVGGGSVTDGPNRFIYYPSHAAPGSQGGVVLAVYCWSDDASRWDSQDEGERYTNALRGLQDVHGARLAEFFTGRGQTQSWLRNRYACGEAAVFSPGQLTRLHPAIPTPEGPIHFAGEHTSLKHAWIEGALESAVRAASEVNESR